MREPESYGKAAMAVRLIALLMLALVIAVADTLTDLEIAVGVFQIVVVLLAVRLLPVAGVIAMALLCMVLTVISYEMTTSRGSEASGLINCIISLAAIAMTTWLALRMALAIRSVHEARSQLARIARVNQLGELTASIAHEVNQPLSAIVTSGNACQRWLASEPVNLDKARQAVERMISDANRAGDIIVRVRALAKRSSTHKEWISVADTVAEIVALAHSEIEGQGVALLVDVPEGLPPLLADRVQIQQVLLNLMLNGVDAMKRLEADQAQLEVRVGWHDGGNIGFSVIDNGIGVPPENLHQLFDAFYTTKEEGMGIGLAISRSIIEAHGGRIWVTPNPAIGATFHFTLPTGKMET
ncbi:His Kinase A (phospho-acceptor) domain-containing protein [Pseudomonas congelans]|nr:MULTISPECIES: ATP-binding protein [Pseudomonas]MBC8800720.1 two-component sensor histidine kinase [Pseudomonas congelans]MBP1145925.1 signal transduction histidine kinase [Pseudomonas sp. PvP027]PBP99890.1 two-component sensor histidine kinase [Pseudomonas congelans]QVX17880.1 two-component sensor histidine kinase [Pseudomonas congelans]SDP78257.1 His Kinase A (phospho-acceptor) domain-containing protein [Pseudomonas congelans]